MTCSVICSAVSTGTPFSSNVASVRENWANKLSFTTLPKTGTVIFQLSNLRRPCCRGLETA